MTAPTKKLINTVPLCVEDCLEGVVAINPGLQVLDGHRVIVRADVDEVKAAGKVTIICGGGSGHEPAHGGFVGDGMLSAAVAGSVFTSPPPNSILAAVRAVGRNNPGGTLIVVKNYTGDRLNFGIASERAKAEGLKMDMVVVGEDCALTSSDKTAGRRGLTGTILAYKIAGALANEGKSLNEIVDTIKKASQEMGTIGLSLSPCSVPGAGPSFTLSTDEMELGLGIHGEAGVRRLKVGTAHNAVDVMLSHMTNPESTTHLKLQKGDSVALVVNNLGGTSILELHIVAKEAINWLENKGISVERAYCGSFMTSLEMAGVNLTVLKLDDTRKRCLDAPTNAPGWCAPMYMKGQKDRKTPKPMKCPEDIAATDSQKTYAKTDKAQAELMYKAVSFACEAVGNCEQQLNTLDLESGDGDCGATLKRGTDAIREALGSADSPGLPVDCPSRLALSIASLVEQHMGGSSGALYSLFLSAAATPLVNSCSADSWCKALQAGIQAIQRYGGAEPGDRTMLDALHPAYVALSENLSKVSALQAMAAAVQAAEQGAIATAQMKAKAGRASYVSEDHLKQPDPGAHAVGIWMRAAYEACKLMAA